MPWPLFYRFYALGAQMKCAIEAGESAKPIADKMQIVLDEWVRSMQPKKRRWWDFS